MLLHTARIFAQQILGQRIDGGRHRALLVHSYFGDTGDAFIREDLGEDPIAVAGVMTKMSFDFGDFHGCELLTSAAAKAGGGDGCRKSWRSVRNAANRRIPAAAVWIVHRLAKAVPKPNRAPTSDA